MASQLWAISDLHVEHPINAEAVTSLPDFGEDWLIIAGDVGNSCSHLSWTLSELSQRFNKLFWTPGNHDLWVLPSDRGESGVARYHSLVDICRQYGCITPEDPFELWSETHLIAPVFTLYDYSFRPEHVALETAVEWALEADIFCSDEVLLATSPYKDVVEWSASRVGLTERRLEAARNTSDRRLILVSHYPFRRSDVVVSQNPRFSIWCGTQATAQWPIYYKADACVYGHLHCPNIRHESECIYAEVSFGYPRHRTDYRDLASALTLVARGDELFPQPLQH